mmetsp:Transcript_3241/g.3585  ORF Transcript_3241/g.3585 Transcript_3241/m.3585 type:complete len:119 (-) Transcript_3241:14-370(-)
MNNDGDNLFEVIYRGGRLDNDYDGYDDEDFQHNPNPPQYTVPDGPFRLVIHSSVTVIDTFVCYGCTTLTEIMFHENVIEIGRYVHLKIVRTCNALSYQKDSSVWKSKPLRIVLPSQKS